MVRVFVVFLLESRMCIASGRVEPTVDDFTSVSTKGRAVVDCIESSHDFVRNCIRCEVSCMRDVAKRQEFNGLSCCCQITLQSTCLLPWMTFTTTHMGIGLRYVYVISHLVSYDPVLNLNLIPISVTDWKYLDKYYVLCPLGSSLGVLQQLKISKIFRWRYQNISMTFP